MSDNIENSINRIIKMEMIFDEAQEKIQQLENAIEEFTSIQSEIRKLEEYYQSKDWKEDFKLDESGELPKDLKRGVLSEDGIYNLLEKNSDLDKLIKEEID
ncbi:MAG: DUF4298 domain-containing protein [Lachnospiraceae bacterium]|nr:DUF4298 domain-containing protein [Lachnospiraceae bacterium]